MKVPTDFEVTHATKIEVTRMEVPTNHQLIGRNGKNLNRELSPLLGRKRVILTIRVSVSNGRFLLNWLKNYSGKKLQVFYPTLRQTQDSELFTCVRCFSRVVQTGPGQCTVYPCCVKVM